MTDHLSPTERAMRESIDRVVSAATPETKILSGSSRTHLATALLAEGWTPPAPPPLTDEPTDLAARVVDKDGDVWAYLPDKGWLCASTVDVRSWSTLGSEYGPLRLWEPSGE